MKIWRAVQTLVDAVDDVDEPNLDVPWLSGIVLKRYLLKLDVNMHITFENFYEIEVVLPLLS